MDKRKKLLRRGICPKCRAMRGMGDIDDRGRSTSHICFKCGCETFLVGSRVVCTITERGLDVAATHRRILQEMAADPKPEWYTQMIDSLKPETPAECNALEIFGATVRTAGEVTPPEELPKLMNAVINGVDDG